MDNKPKVYENENIKNEDEKEDINKIENEKNEIISENKNINIDELWNKTSLYKINYTNIINSIKKGNANSDSTNEYLCNILLMPLKIEISDKVSTLNLLSGFYKKRNQSHLLYSITNKFEKNLESLMSIEPALVVNVFVKAMEYLQKQGNYIYAYKYLMKTKKILEKNAYIIKQKYNMDTFDNFCAEIDAFYIKNVIIYRKKFYDDESIKMEEIQEVKKIVDLLIDDKYEIGEGNEYLYAINKKWILKTKSFIENYIKAKSGNIKNFFEESFEPKFIYESYFDIKIEKDKNSKDSNSKPKLFFAFPGLINNFEITSFKDYWNDSIKLDENNFIKNDLKLNENYLLINEKDWTLLSNIFGATNSIRRRKNSIDLLPIKFILFDKRINTDYFNSYLLKQKYILINKNSTMKELKQKIIRVTNDILNIDEDEIEEKKNTKIENKEKKQKNGDNEKNGNETKSKKNDDNNKENDKKEENKGNQADNQKSNDNIEEKAEKKEEGKHSEEKKEVEKDEKKEVGKEEKSNEKNKDNNDKEAHHDKETKNLEDNKNQEQEKLKNEAKSGNETENDTKIKIEEDKNEANKANKTKKKEKAKDFKISFFILDKDKKDILIEMAFSFILQISMYDSIFINEIPEEEIEDSKPLTNLLNIYKKEKHILIIELYESKDDKFLYDLKRTMKKGFKCSKCSKIIDNLKDRYKCEICNYSLYCSEECSNKSKMHNKLNKQLYGIKDKKFVLSELLSMNLDEMISKNSNHGRVGLGNMGNTCYMNSALQCLSNTEDLTKYFLFRSFKTEINNASSLSSKGLISRAYYNLIETLWNEPYERILPKNFRITFCKKTGLFMNHEQQDSQEFLLALLDNLHEDLNRITNKQYKELEEQRKGESDEEASKRWWDYYKSRENSIIVDLFQGQYKSTISCCKCGKSSTSYDTYMSLGLPIPSQKTQIQIKFFTEDLNFIDLNIKLNSDIQIKDIIKKAISVLDKEKYKKFINNQKKDNNDENKNEKELEVPTSILYNSIEVVEFNDSFKMTNIYKTTYENINNNIKCRDNKNQPLYDNLYLNSIYINNYTTELILYEKSINSNSNGYVNIYIYPITTKKIEGVFFDSNKDVVLSYPILFSISQDNLLVDLESIIYEKFKQNIISKIPKKDAIEICYPHLNKEWGKYKSQDNICPICQKKFDKKYCQLINKNMTIADLIKKQPKNMPVILFAKSQYYKNSKEFYKGIPLLNEKSTADIKNSRNNLSIYDAFDLFNKVEYLEGDNQWYCNNCKAHQNATKKIEIYNTPLYLIVQLKRFKHRNNIVRFIFGSKNSTYIDYKEVLNLEEFVVGPDKTKSVYNLYAITIHREFMNGGHYYAFCKNKGIWCTFDDEKVSKCENPISKDAYLLFYKRKI